MRYSICTLGFALPAVLGGCVSAAPASSEQQIIVDHCVELALELRDACSDSGASRVALWESYASLCTTGNAALLANAMECFEGECRAFSDPSYTLGCLQAVHAEPSGAHVGALAEVCVACGAECNPADYATTEILPYLDASSLECTVGVCSLADLTASCVPD